jgi:hypothetical protein
MLYHVRRLWAPFGAHDHSFLLGDQAMLTEVGTGPGVVWIVRRRAYDNRDPEPDLL